VCINTPTAYKAIFGPKGNVQKSDYYKIWPKEEGAINTWSATSVSQHARKRRVLNYAFSESALRNAEPFIHMNMDRWLDLLGQQKQNSSDELTNPIDMEHQVTYLVMDILGDLCFGKSFNMKEDEGSDLRHIPGLMVFFCEFLTIVRLPLLLYSHPHPLPQKAKIRTES
jgi:cytochrome P450